MQKHSFWKKKNPQKTPTFLLQKEPFLLTLSITTYAEHWSFPLTLASVGATDYFR